MNSNRKKQRWVDADCLASIRPNTKLGIDTFIPRIEQTI